VTGVQTCALPISQRMTDGFLMLKGDNRASGYKVGFQPFG